MPRLAGLALALCALWPAHVKAQAPLLDLAAGHLHFTLGTGDNVRLTLRGVPVIRRSTLYLVSPGWTKNYFDQDNLTPVVEKSVEGDAQVGTASYTSRDATATYRYEVRPDDTFRVTLTFSCKQLPAEVEYDAGYLNADLLRGAQYMASTNDGVRSGLVPLVATSADQTQSRLTPLFKNISFQTILGSMRITVDGSSQTLNALTLFDARLEPADWARRNPIFWLGVGSPSKPISPGDNTIIITYAFGLPNPNATMSALEGKPKLVNLPAVQIPYTPDRPVIPHPKEMEVGSIPVRLSGKSAIVIPDDPSEEEKQAARELQAEFKAYWNVRLPISRNKATSNWKGETSIIWLGRTGWPDFVHGPNEEQRPEWGVGPQDAPPHSEGYYLLSNGPIAGVLGTDPRGVYNGAQTLKQLIRVDAKGVYIKPVVIRDWPSLSFRGVHWFGGPQSYPFHRAMIERIVAPLKMNAMVYQTDYAQWASQPAIWNPERSTPLADVKQTVDTARAHFLEPIPLINSMGHAEWLFQNKQNLDIAADPSTPFAYNPENPETYKRLFAIYDEAIAIFHPKTFHIGNDEITIRGQFPPEGVTKSASQLIIEDTTRRHDWLKAKGIGTMMWGDMLLYKDEANDAGQAPTPQDAKERREGLPRDITIADWHYTGSDPNFKSVPLLQGLGYKVVGTSWFNWGNIQNFARDLVKNNSVGLLQSTWAGYAMSLDLVKSDAANQFVAYLVAAEYAWNGGEPGLDKLGYSPDDAFLALWNRQPVSMAKRPGFTVDLSPVSNAVMWQWLPGSPESGVSSSGSPASSATSGQTRNSKPATRNFPSGRVALGGTVFQLGGPVWLAGGLNPAGAWPKSVTIPLTGKTASELSFLWGTTANADRDTPVARVTVTYADGSTQDAPIRYGHEIFAFDDLRAGPEMTTAWRGTSPLGQTIALRRWTWKNPSPSKKLKNVTVASLESEAAPVLLGLTGLTK